MRGMLCFKEEKRMQQEYLQIGEIVRPQGIRGEVKLRAMTEDMSRYARLESVFLKKNGRMEEKKVLKGRSYDGFAFLQLEGVSDRDAAEALRGAEVYVDRRHAIKLGADENFVCELIGLRAVDETGETIGTLRDVLIGYFPPRMFTNFHYVLLACLCALVVFIIARVYKERYVAREKMIEQINNVFDAVGLGVFAVSGARIGMEAGFADNMFLTTFLGATTAIGGGMLRDVLLREMPFVLKKRVYAVAAILGALGYALLLRAGVGEIMAYGLGMMITTAVRILATVFRWNLPKAI